MSLGILSIALGFILVSSIAAVIVVWLTRRDLRLQAIDQSPATRQQIESGIRQEVDRLRSDSTEQGRALRQELADNVRGFQSTILQSVTSLGEQQSEQMRGFGEAVGNSFSRTEQRTADIAQRVAEELQRITTTDV